jgi:hypothetical protein
VDTEWLPLLTAPNQPEYAGAHGSIMSAVAEVLTEFFGTDRINVDIHRLDSADALHAVRHFETASQLRQGDRQCQAMGRTAFSTVDRGRRRSLTTRGAVRHAVRSNERAAAAGIDTPMAIDY